MSDIESRGYSNPEVLVSTDWVAEHSGAGGVRLVESNEDPLMGMVAMVQNSAKKALAEGE